MISQPALASEGLDVELIDSQYGDRVLFEAQLALVANSLEVGEFVRRVAKGTSRDEQQVRAVLRSHRRRFQRLPDGRLTLSAEALR